MERHVHVIVKLRRPLKFFNFYALGQVLMQLIQQYFLYGRVQGVGYRQFVYTQARALGLCGTVQNRPDGSVQTIVVGEPAAVRALAERLREGPPAAMVTKVELLPYTGNATWDDFRILF